ncbi:metallophosphoesterase [Helicobacter himalayensis]|uniref:metallophosphoesterase n=1 Tax=Helicobacter himalayensis TaxID=1591088 RepID=UPI00082D1BAA|nr:metallophosphoesterase [Helicobacter himalayensis]
MEQVIIANDALFVADSHWGGSDAHAKKSSKALLALLDSTNASQVFLMGDIAQVLVGNLKKSKDSNCALLESVRALSERAEVFWFEGNHDFGLRYLDLPNVHIISRSQQPLLAEFNGKSVSLAHGDLFLNFKYKFYIGVLNSSFGLWCVKIADILTKGKLYENLERKILQKKVRDFEVDSQKCEEFCKKRLLAYKKFFSRKYCKMLEMTPKIIIEGHFHLDARFTKGEILYICLPSFYINGSIFALQ